MSKLQEYQQTKKEEIANSLTHGAGLIIAIIAFFLPLASLLVIMVYKSPLEKAVSSRDNLKPMFCGNNNQSLA